MRRTYVTEEQVRKNVSLSYMLVLILAAFVLAVSWIIGYMLGSIREGLLYGLVIGVFVIPLQLITAKGAILLMTKGQKADAANPTHLRAIRKVEGLAIAAGMRRTPDVYIVPSALPNAFASGWSEKDAFVGVTEGLLEQLTDRELEGVIAHEISHIVHRDIMVSQMTVALVSLLIILAGIASRMAFFGNGKRRGKQENSGSILALIMLIALLLRPLAHLIGNLLLMAVSRKREYAADAGGVRLCGYADGLADALEKIGRKTQYTAAEKDSLGGNEMRALYISFPAGAGALFSTHPPIAERVRILRNMY